MIRVFCLDSRLPFNGQNASENNLVWLALNADGQLLSANDGSPPLTFVRLTHYSQFMVKTVQPGQVWRSDENGDNFLVTKVYGELFTQYAMLRPAKVSAPDAETIRVKITKDANGMTLPGYTFTQDSQDF